MIDKLIQPVTKILDKFIPDADTKQQIAHELATMSQKHIHEIAKAQIEVNKEEAKVVGFNHHGDQQQHGYVLQVLR